MPVTPIYAESVGIDEKQLIWVMFAFFVPQTLASVWCIFYKVKAADALIWISYVITAVFFCLLPFAETLFAVCIVHAVTGLTLGFIFPLLVSKVVQLGTPQLKMSVMGFYQSFYALGFFLGPVVAGKVAELFGLPKVFWFAGALSLAAACIMLFSKQFRIFTAGRRDKSSNIVQPTKVFRK